MINVISEGHNNLREAYVLANSIEERHETIPRPERSHVPEEDPWENKASLLDVTS